MRSRSAEQGRHVLGAQANMWTHVARTPEAIDRMIFPRLIALAEATWTPADRKDWKDFAERMKEHCSGLAHMSVTYDQPTNGLGFPNLTAGPDGTIWLVDESCHIRVRRKHGWEPFPGQARQIAVGPKGRLWAVGVNS